MKELIKTLNREDLINFLQAYTADKEELLKLNTKVLLGRITKLELTDEDISIRLQEIGYNPQQEQEQETKQDKVIEKEVKNTQVYSSNSQELQLRQLVAQQRRRAEELVVISVTSNDPNDISINKECVAVNIENEHFAIGYLVPLNIPVEVPRCIYEYLRDTYMLRPRTLSPEEQVKQKKTYELVHINKYNISVIRDTYNGIGKDS